MIRLSGALRLQQDSPKDIINALTAHTVIAVRPARHCSRHGSISAATFKLLQLMHAATSIAAAKAQLCSQA